VVTEILCDVPSTIEAQAVKNKRGVPTRTSLSCDFMVVSKNILLKYQVN
jgi:hypothetical protein